MKEKFDKILEDAGIKMDTNNYGIILESFNKVNMINQRPKFVDLLSNQIKLSLESMAEGNFPEINKVLPEVRQLFEDAILDPNGKKIVHSTGAGLKINQAGPSKDSAKPEPSPIKEVLNDLKELSNNADLLKQMGPANAKEFSEKVKAINDEYNKSLDKDKASHLVKNLESLKVWCQDKDKETNKNVFSKIGNIISCGAKLLKSYIVDSPAKQADAKLEYAQAKKELTQGKQISSNLKTVSTKAQAWTEKLSEKKGQQGERSR